MKTSAKLKAAMTLEDSGDLIGAMAEYKKIVSREPTNVDALFLLGRAYCQGGQIQSGAEFFRKIIALRPSHVPALALLGMVLGQVGRTEDALVYFDRALAIDSNFILACFGRADALTKLGRHSEAIAQFDKALASEPNNCIAWCNRATALETLGRDEEAASSFRRALALKPDMPDVLISLGNALSRLNRHSEAIQNYQRSIALRPSLTGARANLGRALLALDRAQEALDCVDEAIKLEPSAASLHNARGTALAQMGRWNDAVVSFDQALAIDRDYSAALSQKGRVLYMLGRLNEARALVERSITLEPRNTAFYLYLSEMRKFSSNDAYVTAMKDLLPTLTSRSHQEQIELHFALSKAYNDIGEHTKSFEHVRQGNALKRRLIHYDEADTMATFEHIRRVFTSDLLLKNSGYGQSSEVPIFIVGMPRSGSTLIEQILASHKYVYGGGERRDFQDAISSARAGEVNNYPAWVPAMSGDQINAIAANYLARIRDSASSSQRITDKMLNNFIYIGLIHLALPHARIIHARRNPLDTCLSCFSIHFAVGQNFTYDLAELGHFYRAYKELMNHWLQVLPAGVMLEVNYEDLVTDIEGQVRRILNHCHLEWDDACLAFHESDRPVSTASAAQVRRPIYRTSVERWRPYRDQLQPLFAALDVTPE